MFSLLELFEIVHCDKYKMRKRQYCKEHQKLGREAETPSPMTLITNMECMSPVQCQQEKKQDHKAPIMESCGIIVETLLATASSKKLESPDVCFPKREICVSQVPEISHHRCQNLVESPAKDSQTYSVSLFFTFYPQIILNK